MQAQSEKHGIQEERKHLIEQDGQRRYSLYQAARLFFPVTSKGKPTSRSTLYRWTVVGLFGVILESEQVGGRRCVTRAAIERFIADLTKVRGLRSPIREYGKEAAIAAGNRLASVFPSRSS